MKYLTLLLWCIVGSILFRYLYLMNMTSEILFVVAYFFGSVGMLILSR